MFRPELLAFFSAARSLIVNLKNDDSQQAVPIHELASELRELVVEAVDDWFSFVVRRQLRVRRHPRARQWRSWTNQTRTVARANRQRGRF